MPGGLHCMSVKQSMNEIVADYFFIDQNLSSYRSEDGPETTDLSMEDNMSKILIRE